ncbi:MAG: sodium-translocating pyrophosphatase [Cytophagales bacterium]|nr:sodium-translocating pyrophosphatase [Cytophagales bacterium]
MIGSLILWVPLIGLSLLGVAFGLARWVLQKNAGEDKMVHISNLIASGAMEFLKSVYSRLTIFVLLVAGILFFINRNGDNLALPTIALTFTLGAVFSALSGWCGMFIATKANVRTTNAARKSLKGAFNVSFSGGSVMGIIVAGFAILGVGGLIFLFFRKYNILELNINEPSTVHLVQIILETVTGFALGAESVALFARVAGGIYTKAADVGADLVGKIEKDIPEDDPRNPATIADNVGDNVGDIAGMGADLFGSYVSTILAAMLLGSEVLSVGNSNVAGIMPVLFPLIFCCIGTIVSVLVGFCINIFVSNNIQKSINVGLIGATVISGGLGIFLCFFLLPETLIIREKVFASCAVAESIIVGLVVGFFVGIITQYYTSKGQKPVDFIIAQSKTGPATNIIAGLCVGMRSTAWPMILFSVGIFLSYYLASFYGVAMAAVGMMSTMMLQMAIDGFGPIADNAGGIAEMSGLEERVRENTDILDTIGNTTAATGKGFAIASAALTSLALFAAYVKITGISTIDIYKSSVLSGLFCGAMIPFVFSAMTISSVGKAAGAMVEEVRRQFREIKGIMSGEGSPEYEKCIAISTKAALKGMIFPGILAIASPIAVGFFFGPEVLGGFLAGITVSGILMAMFQSNAGGAWDNAKKSFEKGVLIDGEMFYKKSEPHKASVTGDTVGDPLKDTSGPSMNILIKLSSIVALVIAPFI